MLNKLLTGVAISIMAAGVVYADGGRDRGHMDRPSFEEIDTNGDGSITAAELDAQRAAKFTDADTDGNGEISLEEAKAKMAERKDGEVDEDRAAKFERVFNAQDKDGSGGLSMDEQSGKRQDSATMIARLDADGDGAISEEEFNEKRAGRGKRK